MKAFSYKLAGSTDEATGTGTQSAFIAGGTNLVDLMKIDVMDPKELVDINQLPMRGVTLDNNGLRIGALEKMAYVAEQPDVVQHFPVISQALLKSASAQLRNMASIGGNLMQRTRCGYFRDVIMPCNKRVPGSGCPAFTGENRMHAILGVGNACCATHPSDLAVALVALDASINLQGPKGTRSIKLDDFYLLPKDTPNREHAIEPGELITGVTVPHTNWYQRSAYLKIRDRESYEFALCSAAVALDMDAFMIRDARIAAGGVGTKPWKLPEVAQALIGKRVSQATFEQAAEIAAKDAHPLSQNGFKVTLLKRTLTRALVQVGGGVA
ncbi:MAG: xanthine dehydrogenase family protein subunit M [Verrucomicrobia bacterium]|nr:xanthine dehydrogenase family protein subunit M [Verrucomicrobiota bacterium]MBV8481303.1 xanthine dehydrogenase family protein subunit M [Verrucomicrobiota bacterium]